MSTQCVCDFECVLFLVSKGRVDLVLVLFDYFCLEIVFFISSVGFFRFFIDLGFQMVKPCVAGFRLVLKLHWQIDYTLDLEHDIKILANQLPQIIIIVDV